MSANTPMGCLRKRRSISSKLANSSGPVRRAQLSETPLNFQAALATRRTFPGLFGFSTGCVGRYQNCGGGGCCFLLVSHNPFRDLSARFPRIWLSSVGVLGSVFRGCGVDLMWRNDCSGVACRVSMEVLFRTFCHCGSKCFEVTQGILCHMYAKHLFALIQWLLFQHSSIVPECRWKLIEMMFHRKWREGASRR